MGIETTTTTYGGGDYTGLKSARGTEYPATGTLDVSEFTISEGVIPALTPLSFNGGTGLYEPAAETATADTLAGFLGHDLAATTTGANQPAGIITDATIIAANVPGTHDLTDGRYLCDQVAAEES
jgi:hypothetical protein